MKPIILSIIAVLVVLSVPMLTSTGQSQSDVVWPYDIINGLWGWIHNIYQNMGEIEHSVSDLRYDALILDEKQHLRLEYQYDVLLSHSHKILNYEERITELERAVVMLSSSTRNVGPVLTPIIGIEGKVYNDFNDNDSLDAGESGVPNRTVILVNLTNLSDIKRLTTDPNGDYSIELDAGSGWLVQVEGTNVYSYVTVQSGAPTITNLGL